MRLLIVVEVPEGTPGDAKEVATYLLDPCADDPVGTLVSAMFADGSGTLTWTRIGTQFGPANVLNGRYMVRRATPAGSTRWVIEDLDTGTAWVRRGPREPVQGPALFHTMSAAKIAAEFLIENGSP